MQRGELYWVRLAPRSGAEQRGRRPAVIVSNDGFNQVSTWRSFIIVPLTTSARQARRGPSMVVLSARETGLSKDSHAICHQITTLDRSKIEQPIGALSRESMQRVEQGIAAACDLDL